MDGVNDDLINIDEKLKAKILVSCFLHQTGFMPDDRMKLESGELCVTGNGRGLAWSWPSLRVVDEVAFGKFQERIDSALERFRREKPESVVVEKKPKAPKDEVSEKQLEIF